MGVVNAEQGGVQSETLFKKPLHARIERDIFQRARDYAPSLASRFLCLPLPSKSVRLADSPRDQQATAEAVRERRSARALRRAPRAATGARRPCFPPLPPPRPVSGSIPGQGQGGVRWRV